MRAMSAKKTNLTVAIILLLIVLGAGLSWFLRPNIVVVGLDSTMTAEQKRALFTKHAHEITYPDAATEVCFRLEPGFYKDGEVYGEYVRFKADEATIQSFVDSELGLDSQREEPSPYSKWHQGVGDYPWWRPISVEAPTFYEDGRRFITVDGTNGIVYYSFVRSYSVVQESSRAPERQE